MQAKGEFDVKRTPQGSLDMGDGFEIGHMRFDKQFHGALDATSVVHMLAAMSPVDGSGAYVAIERIVGTLDGLSGSFLAQHNGILDRGTPAISRSIALMSARMASRRRTVRTMCRITRRRT